jgi:hypothetical protein
MTIEIRKKTGDLVQITTPDERWYAAKPLKEMDELATLSPEDFYPSSTWICSFYPKGKQYMKWLADKGWDNAEEIKNAAGEKGSRVHHACDDLMQGVEVKIDAKYPDKDGEMAELTAEEYGICMTFRKFLEDEQPEILGIEYTVLNHEHKYAGTVDIKCRIKSDDYQFVHIIDIKTSADVYPSHEIQVSSYKEADPECEKIDILQVGYKRNKSGYKLTPIVPQFDVFLAAKRIWQKETEGVVIPQRLYPLSLQWKFEKPAKGINKKVA